MNGDTFAHRPLLRQILATISLSLLTYAVPSESISSSEMGPAPRDAAPPTLQQPPASMEELRILSHGALLNGLMYLPGGIGPHPIVILLHGYPGNERNLDLAQRVRRAGFIALYFDYRGDFGSGGVFSFSHSLEDTTAVLAWVRAPENVAKYAIDPTRIALVGHSLGGWLALLRARQEPPRVCVAALAAWNVGWAARGFAKHLRERVEMLDLFRATSDSTGGPIHANAEDLLEELIEHASEWDYSSSTSALMGHALLFVAATRDSSDEGVERQAEIAEALRREGAKLVRVEIFEDDHPFSSHRVELGEMLVRWLQGDCSKTQAGASKARK